MLVFPPIRLRAAWSLGGLSVRELAVRTWKGIIDNEIMTRAAAVSFYAMLALVPFLALIITFAIDLLPDLRGPSGATIGFGNMTVGELLETLKKILPADAYELFVSQIAEIQKKPKVGLISFSVAIALWLASSLFVAIIDAMNRIYRVTETRPFWKIRLTAIVMTIIQAVILIGSLLAIVAWPEFVAYLGLSHPARLLALAVQWLVVVVMVLLSFALSFYVGPDADQRWEWITPGSVLGTIAFLLVSLGFRLYVQNFANYDKTYGSLGGVMVLLFWFWISSLVLLASAQINKLIEGASPLGKSVGQKVEPEPAPDFESMKPEPASS
jgi:membrane protein